MKWLRIALVLGIIIAADARRDPPWRNGRRFSFRGIGSSSRESNNACSEVPTISMGRGIPRRAWSGGIRVQFACYYDYHIYGEKYVTCKNGHWSDPFPICTSNDCEHPSIPEGVRPLPLRRKSVLLFSCDEGMVTDGHKMIYCQNKHWSGPPPKCIHRHMPLQHCTFNQDACGWLNGYSSSLTWALHPGGYTQTRTPDRTGSYDHWTFIDSLLPTFPLSTSTLASTSSSTSTRLLSTTTSSSTTISSTASSVIVNTSSTDHDLRSSTPTSESYSLHRSTPKMIPADITTSTTIQESSSTLVPSVSSTNQPTARKSKRSVRYLSSLPPPPPPPPPQRAELVSPEYPANYSGACFRLQYLANGTIPLLYIRVDDSEDVYLEAQNITIHAQHRNWEEASFEVPAVLRPFRVVIVAERTGVAVKDVRLDDTACNADSREEQPTTEPWFNTDETTDTGTTENSFPDQVDTTEIPSTTTKRPPLSTSPTSISATSIGSTSTTKYILWRPFDGRIRGNPYYGGNHYPRKSQRVTPFRRRKASSQTTRIYASTKTTSKIFTTTIKPVNTTAAVSSPTRLTTTVLTSKVTNTTEMLSSGIKHFTTKAATTVPSRIPLTDSASSPVNNNPTFKLADTGVTSSPTTSKIASTSSGPGAAFTTTFPKEVIITSDSKGASNNITAKEGSLFSATRTVLKTPSHEVDSTTSLKTLSSTTATFSTRPTRTIFHSSPIDPKQQPTTTTYPTTISPTNRYEQPYRTSTTMPPEIPTRRSWTSGLFQSTQKPALTNRTFKTNVPRTVSPITRSSTLTSYERPWRTASTSKPSEAPPRRYRPPGVFQSTPKPIATNRTLKINQSMEAWPGPRFKVRTKYISEVVEPQVNEHSTLGGSTSTSSDKAPGVTHWEIAMLLIATTLMVGVFLWCLRKRFSWLQSSRIKLGDTYSLQINYADDVGLDVLPSLGSGRNGATNGNLVEESSADGEKKRHRRKKCSGSSAFGGFNRLKGSKNYSELSD